MDIGLIIVAMKFGGGTRFATFFPFLGKVAKLRFEVGRGGSIVVVVF